MEKRPDLAIDINDHRLNAYINFKFLHPAGFQKTITDLDVDKVIYKENIDGDLKKFLRKILKYEVDHEYKYKNGRKGIAAVRLEILLPRKLKLKSDRVKFIKKFIYQLNPLHYTLPYVVSEVVKGSATYLVVLMSEREFIDTKAPVTYNRNYYSKNGDITHAKGEQQHDKKGNVLFEHILFSNKVRLFTLSKFKNFNRFMDDLKEKYVIALKNMIHHVEQRFTLKKQNAKKIWHFYNRKCVTEMNHAKQYVEMLCSNTLTIQRLKVIDFEKFYEEQRGKSVPIPKAKEIYQVFYKYKARFDKGEFHDSDQVLRKISYKNVDLQTLQINLNRLMKELNKDLKVATT